MGSSSFHSDRPDSADTEHPSVSVDIREVLFGDEPLERVATYAAVGEHVDNGILENNPWAWFSLASQRLSEGNSIGAIAALQKVLGTSGLEVRIYLQAWHSLRTLGLFPPEDQAREIQGVVVEVALERGLDIVAAYSDGSARYINYSGAVVIWDSHEIEIEKLIAELLNVGQSIVDVSDPWDGPRPSAPSTGNVRINLLTFGGLYFGQGSFAAVSHDGLGGLALRGAFDLMQALMAVVKKPAVKGKPKIKR